MESIWWLYDLWDMLREGGLVCEGVEGNTGNSNGKDSFAKKLQQILWFTRGLKYEKSFLSAPIYVLLCSTTWGIPAAIASLLNKRRPKPAGWNPFWKKVTSPLPCQKSLFHTKAATVCTQWQSTYRKTEVVLVSAVNSGCEMVHTCGGQTTLFVQQVQDTTLLGFNQICKYSHVHTVHTTNYHRFWRDLELQDLGCDCVSGKLVQRLFSSDTIEVFTTIERTQKEEALKAQFCTSWISHLQQSM